MELLENEKDIRATQRELEKALRRGWQSETRTIAWRPDSKELRIAHDGNYWFASYELDDAATPRYWNSFGRYRPHGNLQIDLEVNVPTLSNSRRVAGFFAKDAEGNRYLFHDGSLGGGREGVSRERFLSFLGSPLVSVTTSSGDQRLGVLVASIDGESTHKSTLRFLQAAIDFKDAVSSGEINSLSARSAEEYGRYFSEFSGSKRRKAQAEVEYITRHGDVIEALRQWRLLAQGEFEFKSPYLDWAVTSKGSLIELYEVKTACDRQSLYTAIGQLVVYAAGSGCRCILVLPREDLIPDDVGKALKRPHIDVLRFDLDDDRVWIVG